MEGFRRHELFNSFQFSAVLIIIYVFSIFIIVLYAGKLPYAVGAAMASAISFGVINAAKYAIGATVAWLIGKEIFSLACAINIMLIAMIVSEGLSAFFLAAIN